MKYCKSLACGVAGLWIFTLWVILPAHAVAAEPVTVIELSQLSGSNDQVFEVTGYDVAGGGGGGIFYFDGDPVGPLGNGGTVITAPNGRWLRLFSGPIRSEWFGVIGLKAADKPDAARVAETTTRLQRAIDAAAGGQLIIGPGIHYVSDTLLIPMATRIEGVGQVYDPERDESGTEVRTHGPGKPRRWADTGMEELDRYSALMFFRGGGVHLFNLRLYDENQWDAGAVIPSVKRCSMDSVTIDGQWALGACFLDGTHSDRNEALIDSLRGLVRGTSGNESTFYRCTFSGRWGLNFRGAIGRDPNNWETQATWLWCYGGTSDTTVIDCVLEGSILPGSSSPAGGAYNHDVPMKNAAQGGQGHRFIGCTLRSSAKYMVRLAYSERDAFKNCEFIGQRYQFGSERDVKPVMFNDMTKGRNASNYWVDCAFNSAVDLTSAWDSRHTKVLP